MPIPALHRQSKWVFTRLDPTHGYDLERLLRVEAPPEPPGFAAFWEETWAESRQIPLQIESREIASPHPDYHLFEVEYNTPGPFRTGAWMTVPKSVAPVAAMVVSHGYGGREEPGFDLAGPPAVVLFPCARGFDRSAHSEFSNDSQQHVLHGIERRETYVHRACVAEIWGAASVLAELRPEVMGRLLFQGGSFGGGIGALALAWDPRFHKAWLDVPSFGAHPLRVKMRCTGSGRAVSRRFRENHAVLDVLAFFDAAVAARRIRIPVLVGAALADPAVPPPGQFAIYNALAGPKELFLRTTGHPTIGREDREAQAAVRRWFD